MKTSNHDFLEKISKEALEEANKLDVDEPDLVWPKPEEVRYQKKPYSVPKEGLFMPKGKMKQSFPKSYPI